MSDKITLKYDGTNGVDAVDLANSILGFAKVFSKIAKDKYGDDCGLKIDIHGFEKGSLDAILNIDFDWEKIKEGLEVTSWVIGIIGGVVGLISFLKGESVKKIKPDINNVNNLIVENGDGNQTTVGKIVYNYYVDSSINYNLHKYIEPAEKDDRITSQSLLGKDNKEVFKIDHSEVEFFKSEEDIINKEVSVMGKIYDLNTDTFNGKIDLGGNKVSISFKRVYETEHFYKLVKSLKYKALVSIKGNAEYDRTNNVYKNIDILEVEMLQDTLFEDE